MYFDMRLIFSRSIVAWATLGAGAILLAGCGGSSSGVGNTSTARIRVVDAAYLTSGDSAQLVINGGSVDGNTKYFASGSSSSNPAPPASPYLYVQPQNGASFTYTINNSSTSGTTNNSNISQGNYYTAFLIGREDITTDLRHLQLVLPAQQAGSSSGQATLRVLNAAPDAGFTAAVAPAAALPGSLTVTVGPTTFAPTPYATASSYQTLAPGTLNVTVATTGPGGATVKTGTITVNAGTVYTLVVAEPTVTPAPAYDLRLLSE